MQRVAVLSDVHGNAVALEAVLEEVASARVELIVFGGDLSWGPLPRATIDLVRDLGQARFVRGNAERALLELAGGLAHEPTERERWMLGAHTSDDIAFVRRFVPQLVVQIAGLGATRFAHGSPRSDEECVTPRTPAERVTAFSEGAAERVLVSAHIHVQFDREIGGIRSLNPGSVGLPYEGSPGARWALLGPDVEHRTTVYDVERAVRLYGETDDPRRALMIEILTEPPTREEAITDAEDRVFAG